VHFWVPKQRRSLTIYVSDRKIASRLINSRISENSKQMILLKQYQKIGLVSLVHTRGFTRHQAYARACVCVCVYLFGSLCFTCFMHAVLLCVPFPSSLFRAPMEIPLFKGHLIVVTRSLTRANINCAFPCFIYLHIHWST